MKRSTQPGVRRLSSGHFAFMRSVVQGLDLRSSWDRYLAVEGEGTDLRRVKTTIDWIRSEFAAAARREAQPGTARLVVLDASRVPNVDGRPSLHEFAASVGMEDFSQAEQLEAYEAAFGSGGDRKGSRRKRLIARQLEMVAQEPGAQDGVRAWFAPAIAGRLERAGLTTLALLVTRVNGVGQRWWTAVPGVGDLKARRIVEWVRQHESSIGIRVGQHALVPRAEVRPAQLERVVSRATGVVPLEKFLVPAELDGSEGRFRAPLHQCLLEAKNDYEAIAAWLRTKHDPNGTGKTATHRAYGKEAERLLLWAVLEQRKPLSSLSVEDANAFKWFLVAPPERWCGQRHHQRRSPLWRPLEGPLSAGALRQSMVILRSLFAFLISQDYVIGNPFAAVSLPREAGRSLGSRRALTFGQWDALEERLDDIAVDAIGRRRARVIRWLYSTGLRLSEMAGAQCGDLQCVAYRTPEGAEDTGWPLDVAGKGDRVRQVPVPNRLVDELQDELESQGLVGDVRHESNKDVSILMRVESGAARPLSPSGLGTTSGYLTSERDLRLAAMKGFGDKNARRW